VTAKAGAAPTAPVVTDIENDAVAALVGLGYKPVDARKAVTASAAGGAKPTIEDLIKRSLARLAT